MKFLHLVGKYSSVILTIIWTIVLFAAIFAPLIYGTSPRAGVLFYSALRPLCHQANDRCYHIFGYKMGLCTRCTGIFMGLTLFGWIAILLRPKREIKFTYFVISLLPLFIDGAGNLLGMWSTGNTIRFFTGIIFAFGIVFWTYPFIFRLERPDFFGNNE